MEIQERTIGAVTVLDLTGRLVLSDTLLKDKVHSLVFQNRLQIVLNLADVSHIDSSGIGQLLAARTAVDRAGGQIKLLNVTNKLHDLLTITKLVTVFETFDREADALESFAMLV